MVYCNARKLFLKVRELDPNVILEVPDFSLAQALDEDWLA
ncbi:hypothetical protein [Gloeomargarita sp.]